jgi:polysaccharide export outer membrane protein
MPRHFLDVRPAVVSLVLACPFMLAGCGSLRGGLPSSGPSRDQVESVSDSMQPGGQAGVHIRVVELTEAVARQVISSERRSLFSQTLSQATPGRDATGPGDVLEVSVWEAPPAALFGPSGAETRGAASAGARVTVLPEQMVNRGGTINVPFAGTVMAAGRSPAQIEEAIAARLKGKANQPQVLVRVTRNATANVTVVGEIASSTRMPLTPKGERLLDALAAGGGVRQPVSKMTVQVTRGQNVQTLPLETVIEDPRQNITLQADDVITLLHQPLSFTVLGATGKNEEVPFEARGISLAQALARSGGLQDSRADAKGVFVFRFEDRDALVHDAPDSTIEGKVPVVYQADLKNPSTFFVAQRFPIRNQDVLFVSNAPTAELQKFLNLVLSTIYPIANVINVTR